MTRIAMAKYGLVESVLLRAQRVREALLRVGGVGVAAWVLIALDFGMAFYLMLSGALLFGDPATSNEIPSLVARMSWNFCTARADVTLLLVALLMLLGMRRGIVVLWWAAAFSSALWSALLVFMWIAYLSNHGVFVPMHLLGIVPSSLGAFLCLRLSAESESAGTPLNLWSALFGKECGCDRKRRSGDFANAVIHGALEPRLETRLETRTETYEK